MYIHQRREEEGREREKGKKGESQEGGVVVVHIT
jgi:hypothetical protein